MWGNGERFWWAMIPASLQEDFAVQAAEVLIGNGIPVEIAKGDVPTPVLAHAVLRRGCQGGLMFTASHNPPKYNGIKFIPHYGGPPMIPSPVPLRPIWPG